jgi:hypothetical protein
VVFEHVIDALVHGSGYERIASARCSDRRIRRRVTEWARLGLAERLHPVALAAYDLIIGLELSDLSVDGCMTKAPCGGEKAGPSPVDRRKGGLKRSTATDGYGIPLGIASAGANRHDSPLLAPTLAAAFTQVEDRIPDESTAHLDAAYDSGITRQLLDELGLELNIYYVDTSPGERIATPPESIGDEATEFPFEALFELDGEGVWLMSYERTINPPVQESPTLMWRWRQVLLRHHDDQTGRDRRPPAPPHHSGDQLLLQGQRAQRGRGP